MADPVHIPGISPKSQNAKRGAEQVFSFGDPGDGFDVEWVNGEECGNEGGWPDSGGITGEKQIKQNCIEDMQEKVRQMMALGVQANRAFST